MLGGRESIDHLFLAITVTSVPYPLLGRMAKVELREPLHFTVMSVTIVTLPISMGFSRDGPYPSPRDRHTIVTLIVTEEMP